MNQIYLIDQIAMQKYEDLSANIKPDRLKASVKKAQDLDLKSFLGYALYYDFVKYFNFDGVINDNAPQIYKDLLNGSEYLDKHGHIVLYEGLIPTLVYFTLARFIESDSVHYTATGPIVKHHDNADAVAPHDIIKLVQQHRSVANAHANEVEKFLWDNRGEIPLWQYNDKSKTARQAGPRIRGVDKNDFNSPGETCTQVGSFLLTNEYHN
jgi:hypothetical protein